MQLIEEHQSRTKQIIPNRIILNSFKSTSRGKEKRTSKKLLIQQEKEKEKDANTSLYHNI